MRGLAARDVHCEGIDALLSEGEGSAESKDEKEESGRHFYGEIYVKRYKQ